MGDFVNSYTLYVNKTLLSILVRREVPNSEEDVQVKSTREKVRESNPLVKVLIEPVKKESYC